jgi:ubiquinone biosynthesis protein
MQPLQIAKVPEPGVRGGSSRTVVGLSEPTWWDGRRGEREAPAVRAWAGRVRRYAEIGSIVVRSGLLRRWTAGSVVGQEALGRSLRAACERAGGIYVKLGQMLSTRPDLVSAGVAAELRRLQDAVAPVPARLVTQVITEELGARPDRLFVDFDDRPVAAASVAQVHRARLPNGRRVAVKVQRPEVAQRIGRDVDILTRLAERLKHHTRWGTDQQLVSTVRGFAESLTGELDFAAEADNLTALGRAVGRHEGVIVPEPVPALTGRRVLVMEWIDGEPLATAAPSLGPDERGRLARALLGCFLDQIFVLGTFHVDPHPGNVYLTRDGDIALLDCGAIGRLDRRQRMALQAVLVAVAARDGAALGHALAAISRTVPPKHRGGLDASLQRLLDRHLPPGVGPDATLLGAFMGVMREFGVALEPVVYGALRSVGTLQATLTALAPHLDPLAEATCYSAELAA